MEDFKSNRILLKISGEEFSSSMDSVVSSISKIHNAGVKLGIVVGGGNIMRGRVFSGINRSVSDYMGMLATIMNAISLQSALRDVGIKSRAYSALAIDRICLSYSRNRALNSMDNGITIFAGGIGIPFVSTDTAAVCRALEMECDIMIKATHVEGVYSEDPKKNPNATKYNTISYDDVISKNLQIMDLGAILMARDQKLPIMVMNVKDIAKIASLPDKSMNFTLIK